MLVFWRSKTLTLFVRHLTQVEDELAKAKALLKELRPQRQQMRSNDTLSSLSEHGGREETTPSSSVGPNVVNYGQSTSASHHVSFQEQQQDTTPANLRDINAVQSRASGSPRTTNFNQHSTPNTDALSRSNWSNMLESPPTSGDFEWDERSGKPGGPHFVDGMGSLTSDTNGSGYLGVASGAALLRLAGAGNEHPSGTTTPKLPSIPFALTSLSFLEGFIDAYFFTYHRSYPIVHEATFRAQFMEIIPRPSGNAWQVLLYSVSALGAWSSATQRTETDSSLFEAAKARFSIDLLETGSLVLVQALTLISNYAQMGNKPNSSYNYYGLARRIAMGIGLHKEFPTWQSTPLALEIRRRVWWCLFAFDVGSIITFSRPFDFPQSGIEAELPAHIHDSDLTPSTIQIPQPVNETTLYTHLRAQCTFHLATSQIYSRMISTPFLTAKEMVDLDDRCITQWLGSLPQYFQINAVQPPRFAVCHSTLQWRYRNFRILMYRPFVVRRAMTREEWGDEDNSTSEDNQTVDIAFQRCLDAASESVELISKFWFNNPQTLMVSWYGLYFLFQAILIPVVCLRNIPQSPMAGSWRDQVQEAIRVLESMEQLNPTASRCLRVVRSLSQPYISVDREVDGPTRESLQDQLTSLYPMMWPTLGSEIAQFDGIDAL
jgi:transcriptional regulatory protein GAL4